MAAEGRDITITVRISRRVYFTFKDACRSTGLPVALGIEDALRSALRQMDVSLPDKEADEDSVEG